MPSAVCTSAADCPSGLCRDGACHAISPADGVQDGSETDVDCGGSSSPACDDGKKCLVGQDCADGVCATTCQPALPTDGVKNGDETGVDCGGTKAPKCKTGDGCKANGDCDDVLCDTSTNKCAGVSDGDGLKNGDETGVDCGGPTTPKKCATGGGCAATSDCDRAICNGTTKVCDPPSHVDGITNGDESDVDCGGTAPKRCIDGAKCNADTDCQAFCSVSADGKNDDKICVTARSCAGEIAKSPTAAGLTTCGIGESNDPNNVHESCCKSLAVPGTPAMRLDKYEVTAGRFRQFAQTVGFNVRQWVTDQITAKTAVGNQLASDIPAAVIPYLPASDDVDDPLNFTTQVGGTVMDGRTPSDVQGCYNDATAYGHNTYWMPQSELAAHFKNHPARAFAQSIYDEKSMNCSPYWMYAAFCAWDGGRMPTQAEVNRVWTQHFPFGDDFAAVAPTTSASLPVQPWSPATGSRNDRNPLLLDANGYPDYTRTVNNWNDTLLFYGYPNLGTAKDTAGLIAAPGRFYRDASATKDATTGKDSWMDLTANLMEMVKYNGTGGNTFCDFNVTSKDVTSASCSYQGTAGVLRGSDLPYSAWVGGSWEVHDIGDPEFNFPVNVQYGKAGFRCARAALPTQ